jgi:hypothetical protein
MLGYASTRTVSKTAGHVICPPKVWQAGEAHTRSIQWPARGAKGSCSWWIENLVQIPNFVSLLRWNARFVSRSWMKVITVERKRGVWFHAVVTWTGVGGTCSRSDPDTAK